MRRRAGFCLNSRLNQVPGIFVIEAFGGSYELTSSEHRIKIKNNHLFY